MSFRHWTVIVIFIGCVLGGDAQSAFKIEQFSQQDGLPHRKVHLVFQDAKGLIWVGTEGGLVRYNGISFERVELELHSERLIDIQSVTHISEDAKGRLWFLKDTLQHSIFDLSTNRFYPIASDEIYYPPEHNSISLSERALRFLPQIKDWREEVEGEQRKSIMRQITDGELLSNTAPSQTIDASGIWVWRNNITNNQAAKEWYHYIKFDHALKDWIYYELGATLGISIAHPRLPIDSENRYWFPVAEPGSPTFHSFDLPSDIPIQDWQNVLVDNRRNIWLATKNKALYRYDNQRKTFQYILTLAGSHFSIFIDKEEVIWIATELGLIKAVENKKSFENYLNEAFELGSVPPISNSMRNIVEDQNGNIYTHLNNGKLFQLDPISKEGIPVLLETFQHSLAFKDRLQNIRLADMEMDEDGFLWAVDGMNGGIFRIDLQHQQVEVYDPDKRYNRIFAISPEQIIAFSRDRNLLVLDTQKGSCFEIARISDQLLSPYSYFDKATNTFWAQPANSNELLQLTYPEGESTIYNVFQDSITHIRAWLPEGDLIWLGTTSGLVLFHLAQQKIIAHYTIQDGLPDNIIYNLLKVEDKLWLGTGEGLSCFDLEDKSFNNFFVEDGLCHNEFNTHSSFLASDGSIWMGGLNGMNTFSSSIVDVAEEERPNLVWTKVSLYNRLADTLTYLQPITLNTQKGITLKPSDQSFTFYFALTSFTKPEKNQYNWYLEGYETEWHHSSNVSVANYQNIPAGNYTLRVSAKNYAGIPSGNELVLPVKVKQIWYKQWWAWLTYLIILVGIIGLINRFQLQRKLDKQEARRLKELDELKTKLYTNITHEFRTPLTVLLGMAEEAKKWYRHREEDKHQKSIELIKRNGQHLLSLINQMLDLSKLEAGKLTLNETVVDIVTYLRYIVASFESYAQQKTIRLTFDTAIDQLDAAVDKGKLQNILSNLISNAIKFTPENGEVAVQLTVEGKNFKIEVSDTGIGIAQANLPYIFNRFYQVDDTHTRQNEGTGIGLTLVKELVKLMYGSIQVKSTEGQGTTFILLLPLVRKARVERDDYQIPTTSVPLIASKTPIPAIDTKDADLPILLIVEDNEDVIYYIKSCLEDSYNIVMARNGQEGIDIAIREVPDIIISDVMMPLKDGFELVKTLRKEECTSHIPIILLTAKADVSSKLEGLKRGADAYLSKPFNREELNIRLNKLIEIRKQLQAKYSNIANTPITATPKKELSAEALFLQKIQQHIYQDMQNPHFGNDQLAKQLHISQSQLYRKIKALTGKSTAIYIRSVRLQRGKQLLEETTLNIAEIAYEVGFADPNYFSRTFAKEFGFPPSKTRE